jgi:hypothetical protein
MKLQPLFIALALAAGASFAQAPSGSAKAPDAPAAAPTQKADQAPAPMEKKSQKKHAAARHQEQHAAKKHHEEHMASEHHHNTHAMGAGAGGPVTDLNTSSREHRMDQAYSDWQARQRR